MSVSAGKAELSQGNEGIISHIIVVTEDLLELGNNVLLPEANASYEIGEARVRVKLSHLGSTLSRCS